MEVIMNVIKRRKVPLWMFHGSVSLTIIVSSIGGVICALISKDEQYRGELYPHQYKYMKYLISLWISTFAAVNFFMYSAIDISNNYSKQNKKWLKLVDILHTTAGYLLFAAVFPLSLMVSTIFWVFYYWDRELVYPKALDSVFPPFMNHMMHTFPAILAVLYMVTSNKYEPPKIKTLTTLMTILAVYFACIINVKKRDGKWVYFALEQIRPIYVQYIFIFSIIGCPLFLFLGHFLSKTLKPLRRYLPIGH